MRQTGSRYFGTATAKSDWDFFAEDSPALRIFLDRCGFKPSYDAPADHPQIVTNYHNGVLGVEVLIVKSQARRVVERGIIYWTGMRLALRHKSLARILWKRVSKLVGDTMYAMMAQSLLKATGVKNQVWFRVVEAIASGAYEVEGMGDTPDALTFTLGNKSEKIRLSLTVEKKA